MHPTRPPRTVDRKAIDNPTKLRRVLSVAVPDIIQQARGHNLVVAAHEKGERKLLVPHFSAASSRRRKRLSLATTYYTPEESACPPQSSIVAPSRFAALVEKSVHSPCIDE